MVPGVKRKRGDRTYSADDGNNGRRNSPHQPQHLHLSQQGPPPNAYRGGRRGGRGGSRGGYSAPLSQAPVTAASMQSEPAKNATIKPEPSATPTPDLASTAQQQTTAPSRLKPDALPAPARPQTAPMTLAPPPAPHPDHLSYVYSYLTEDISTNWKTNGRQAVVDAATQLAQKADNAGLNNVFQELYNAMLDRRIDPAEAGSTVKDILKACPEPDNHELSEMFLDILSVLTHDLAYNSRKNVQDWRFPLVGELLRSTGISANLMREVLDAPLLIAAQTVRTSFAQQGVRYSTNLLYRLTAYNLLREDSEG